MCDEKKNLPAIPDEEMELVRSAVKRLQDKPPKFIKSPTGEVIADPEVNPALHYARMLESLGVSNRGLQRDLLNKAIMTAPKEGAPTGDLANSTAALLHEINPKNALEGMLASQMVGVHNMAMEMMSRAMIQGQTVDGVSENINRAAKLLRIFTAQTDALQKLRGKGEQKVTVEHVHVHQGGQAIVGNVEHRGGKDEK